MKENYDLERKHEDETRNKKYNEELQKLQSQFETENNAAREKENAEKSSDSDKAEEGNGGDEKVTSSDSGVVPMEQEDAITLDDIEEELDDAQKSVL